MNTFFAFIVFVSVLFFISISNAYVQTGLPGHRHRAWLTKMTDELIRSPPGNLTPSQCITTPLLLNAWAQNPYIPHNLHLAQSQVYPHHGKECALRCELLLKRLVDEIRAGNPNAVANTEVYNALIDVWSRSGEKGAAAQRAEQVRSGKRINMTYLTSFEGSHSILWFVLL